jgi:hypothetical protein
MLGIPATILIFMCLLWIYTKMVNDVVLYMHLEVSSR